MMNGSGCIFVFYYIIVSLNRYVILCFTFPFSRSISSTKKKPVFTLTRSQVAPPPKQEDHIMKGSPEPEEVISYAIEYDKKDFFLELMRDPEYKARVYTYTTDLLFRYDSVNCVKAVLNGETTGTLEFTADAVPLIWYNTQEVPILHKAAYFQAPLITNLCLPGNESQVNLRIDVRDMKGVEPMKGALPLNLVLQYIRYNYQDGLFLTHLTLLVMFLLIR